MKHNPVMVEEVVSGLDIKKGGVYLDCTVGYGGHAEAILDSVGGSLQYIGLDRDIDAVNHSKARLKKFKGASLHHSPYNQAKTVLDGLKIDSVDGILMDLGASSPQFDESQRGFSFKNDGPLDMRFDISQGITAADVVNTYQTKQIERILRIYGEERFAHKIARAIDSYRKEKQFSTTGELKTLVEETIPKRFWQRSLHPATRTFQALRIEVNEELEILSESLPILINLLKPGGRIVIISFHSLEDRIVKRFFKEAQNDCVCPKDFPVCRCEKEQMITIITKKPQISTKIEIKNNVRARSAKLRIAERK